MMNIKLPYRGYVRGIGAYKNYLYFAVEHRDSPGIGAYRIDTHVAYDKKTRHIDDAGHSIRLGEAGSVAVTVSGDSAYFLGDDRCLYRVPHNETVGTKINIEKKGFSPKFIAFGAYLWAADADQLMALDGENAVVYTSSPFKCASTCLTVSKDGTAVAVGHADGTITLLLAKDDGYVVRILTVHDSQIDAMAFIKSGDAALELVSYAADLTICHTRLDDLSVMVRAGDGKGLHAGTVLGIEPGPLGRFYTFSLDKTIKAWTDKFSQRRPATEPKISAAAACIADLKMTDKKGTESIKPHLLAAKRDSSMVVGYLIEEDEKQPAETGKLGARLLEIEGAQAWCEFHGESDNTRVRRRVIDQLGIWLDAPSLTALTRFARDDGDKTLRDTAFQYLTSSTHPKLGLLLEQVMESGFDDTSLKAFTHLRTVIGKESLRPMRTALSLNKASLAVNAIRALGELTSAGNLMAKEVLLESIDHPTFEVAKEAFEQLAADTDDVSGIVAGTQSSHTRIIAIALERLYANGLLTKPQSQACLRVFRESDNEEIRFLATMLTLLGDEPLLRFVRAADEEIHKQLVAIEASALGWDDEKRREHLNEQPQASDVNLGDLTEYSKSLIMALSACQKSDVSLLGVVTQAQTGDARSLPILLLISQEKDASIRLKAAAGLSALTHVKSATTRLHAMLNDPSEQVRSKAFASLSKSVDPLDVVSSGLNGEHEDTRMAALGLLQERLKIDASDDARQLLDRAILNKNDLRLAREAIKTYRQVIGEDPSLLINKLLQCAHTDLIEEGANRLRLSIRETLESDVALKNDIEPWQRTLIGTALMTENSTLRKEIFNQLLKIFSRKQKEGVLLKEAISCRHANIRQGALQALDPMVDGNQGLLGEAFRDENASIRNSAFRVVKEKFDDVERSPILEKLLSEGLSSPHEDIRTKALDMLMMKSGAWRSNLLWIALFDDVSTIRTDALDCLLSGGEMQAAIAALNSPHRDLRLLAAMGLAREGDSRSLPALLELIARDKPKAVDDGAKEADKEAYEKALTSWYEDIEAALPILGELGDERAFEPVQRLLKYEDDRLTLSIVSTLGNTASPKHYDILAGFLSDSDSSVVTEAAKGLVRSGDVRGLRDMWQRGIPLEERMIAALTIGPRSALDFVLSLIQEKESISIFTLLSLALEHSAVGGDTLVFSTALTAPQTTTKFVAAELLETCYDQTVLFERLLELLKPHSQRSDSAIEAYKKEHDCEPPSITAENWRQIASLLSQRDFKVKARIVPLLYKRFEGEISIEAFLVELGKLSRRFKDDPMSIETINIDRTTARQWAAGAYAGILRTVGAMDQRVQSMRRLCEYDDTIISKSELRSILFVAMTSDHEALRSLAIRSLHKRRASLDLTVRDIVWAAMDGPFVDVVHIGLNLLAADSDQEAICQIMSERSDIYGYMAANVLLADTLSRRSDKMLDYCASALNAQNRDLRIITANRLCYTLEQFRFDEDIKTARQTLVDEEIEKQREEIVKQLEDRDSLRDGARNEAFIASLLNISRLEPSADMTPERILSILKGGLTGANGEELKYTDVRYHIAESLSKIGQAEALSTLEEMIQSDVAPIQKRAIDALENYKSRAAAKILVDRLKNDPTQTAQVKEIFNALAKTRQVDAADSILSLIDEYPKHVVNTVLAISGHETPIDAEAKWDEMTQEEKEEEEKEKRDDVVLAKLIAQVARIGAYAYLKKLLPAAKTARSTTGEIDDAVAKLAILPRRPDTDSWRQMSVSIIGWRLENRQGPHQILVSVLESRDPLTRFLAAEGLALSEKDAGLPELLKVAKSSEEPFERRRRAITAIGTLGDARALSFLRDIIKAPDKHADLYNTTLDAIGCMSHTAFADQILTALRVACSSDNVENVVSSLGGLRRFNTPDAWLLLRSCSKHSNNQVRKTVGEYLFDDPDPDAAISTLLEMIKHEYQYTVFKTALDSAKRLCGEKDTRPYEAVYQADKMYDDETDEAIEFIEEHGNPQLWLDLLVFGHEQDALKKQTRFKRLSVRLEKVLRGSKQPPIDSIMSHLDKTIRNVVSLTSNQAGTALGLLACGLMEALSAHRDQIGDKRALSISSIAEQLRMRWKAISVWIAKGKHTFADEREYIEEIWTKALWLLGALKIPNDELSLALREKRTSKDLQVTALLALSQLPTQQGREVCRELAQTSPYLDVRTLALSALKSNSDMSAQALVDVSDNLSMIQRIATRGEAAPIEALRNSLKNGHTLAAFELARQGDVEGLAQSVVDNSLAEALRLTALDALGTRADAYDLLATIGKNASQSQSIRSAAWRARKRSGRLLQSSNSKVDK